MAEWSSLIGNPASGTGAITVGLPAGWAADDIFVLMTESTNGQTVATPTGFTQHASSPVVQAATQLGIFWRRAVGGDTSVSVADSGDHTYGRIIAIRGAVTTGDPFEASGTGTGTTSTTISLASATPAGDGRFSLQVASYAADANQGPTGGTFSSVYEDLPFVNGYDGSGTTSGNGGGVVFMYGVVASTSAISGSSLTVGTSTGGHAMMSLVLTPVAASDIQVSSVRYGGVIAIGDNSLEVSSVRLGAVLDTEVDAIQVASIRLGAVLDLVPAGTAKGSISILW
jgi:hypothetical protein